MSRISLYWRPGTCARVPFVALEEIGVPFELVILNAFKGDMKSAEFRALNPRGKVPVLVIDDWVVTENPVVLRVLADLYPSVGLLPAGDRRTEIEAAEMMAWFASGPHDAAKRQRFPHTVTPCTDPERRREVRLKAREELEASFTILEHRLADREWLFGEWSIIDVYMLYLWWRAVGSGMDPRPFPRCADHGRRCEARPTVAKVLDREEAEFARLEGEGWVPEHWEPHYVGRVPTGPVELA